MTKNSKGDEVRVVVYTPSLRKERAAFVASIVAPHVGELVDEWKVGEPPEDVSGVVVVVTDEILYAHEKALERLIEARVQHPKPGRVSASVVNGGRADYMYAAMGVIPVDWSGKFVLALAAQAQPWLYRPEAGVVVHEALLRKIVAGAVDDLDYGMYFFAAGEYFCPEFYATCGWSEGGLDMMLGSAVVGRAAWPTQIEAFQKAKIEDYYKTLVEGGSIG